MRKIFGKVKCFFRGCKKFRAKLLSSDDYSLTVFAKCEDCGKCGVRVMFKDTIKKIEHIY